MAKKKAPAKRTKTKDQLLGEKLADLELRAAADPVWGNSSSARLGWDIIERGETPGAGSGGDIIAYIADKMGRTDPRTGKRFYAPGFTMEGLSSPSDYYGQIRPGDENQYKTIQEKMSDNPEFAEFVLAQLGYQGGGALPEGIASLLPPSKGSTIYYQTGRNEYDDPRVADREGLKTLGHELSHLAQKAVNRRAEKLLIRPEREEQAIRYAFGQPDKHGVPVPEMYSTEAKQMEELAAAELRRRGVPPRATRKTSKPTSKPEPSVMEKLLGLFGG